LRPNKPYSKPPLPEMHSFTLFVRLIRWPNLVFILLTQALIQFCILLPNLLLSPVQHGLLLQCFWLTAFSYVALAAAGYIINDWFDLAIDQLNKPGKVFITNGISVRLALAYYWLLNLLAVTASLYISYRLHSLLAFWGTITCAILLYIYSASLKKLPFWGNLLVALITAWSVIVLLLIEKNGLPFSAFYLSDCFKRVISCIMLYALFSFTISLVREIVKDMEDVQGDARFGCRTMPIAWGIHTTRFIAAGFLVLLMVVLIATNVIALRLFSWYFELYCILLVLLPLFLLLFQLLRAESKSDFGKLSKNIKWVMLSGILSMLFFLVQGLCM
jgi:4-hydroxybenzoate polyprenyltransferase